MVFAVLAVAGLLIAVLDYIDLQRCLDEVRGTGKDCEGHGVLTVFGVALAVIFGTAAYLVDRSRSR